ncbi:MAG: SDR family oxidoreductase [Muribaculaceae bacterium]|nr:SDR family oxidoreductase [Muribaculaceae bacterium]
MFTCVITGAGSGIGRAVTEALAQKSKFHNFVLLGRNLKALQEVAAVIRIWGRDVMIIDIDLTYPEKIPAAIESVYEKYGSIDCLLNIAGYTDPQHLLQTSLESMETTYRINVFAPFMLIKECTRYMKRTGGKILNVASTAGMTPRPGWLSYSSSKAAVISMSQTLTEELAEYGIKIYCVSPGRCATKLRKRLAPNENPDTIMQPNEVANVIVNLIDDKEECLDGQNIVIRKQLNRH